MSSKFLLDGMLGSLARWLSICGYDAEYVQNLPDDELLERAAEGGSILLTRDDLLFRKAQRTGLDAFIVVGDGDAEKLASVARRFDLELNPGSSRCPVCGGSLSQVVKDELTDKVPTRTLEAYDEFWVCDSCGEVFWRGSHWRNIQATIDEARELAARAPRESEQDL
jgi:YgiT-type zinc finger domain-containing protein